MASVTLAHLNSTTPRIREGKAPQQENDLSIDFDNYIQYFPESIQILEFVDRFFYLIHHDKDLPKATLFFKQIIAENEPIFSELSTQEKVDLLFGQYRKMLISVIEKSQEFVTPLFELEARCPKVTIFHSTIRKLVENKINNFHHGFASVAICRSLDARIQDISLPGETPASFSYIIEHLTISSKADKLFQVLIGR